MRIGAVRLQPREPFEWSSGLRAPIYCDNRLTLAHPEIRAMIASGFQAHLKSEGLRPEIIAGTATAGIPHAALLAERMNAPLAYVRPEAKGHGHGKQIEGKVEAGRRVVLVEDLVSTGGSSLAAVEALRGAGAEVLTVLAIFSYGLDAAVEAFRKSDVPLHTLTSLGELLEAARGSLSEQDMRAVKEWRSDPQAWSARRRSEPSQPLGDDVKESRGPKNSPELNPIESPEAAVAELLTSRGLTLAVAESCTGGLVLDRLTDISGASDYLRGGIVAYSNEIKEQQLAVELGALQRYGAVSEAVARQMARGAREQLRADVGVATTGIAGPTGGGPEKPVGAVWIAVDAGENALARRFRFDGDRRSNKRMFADAAFESLREVLEKN